MLKRHSLNEYISSFYIAVKIIYIYTCSYIQATFLFNIFLEVSLGHLKSL